MTNNNLPAIKQQTSLQKIENKLAITNKLLSEIKSITEYHWEWWNNLSNIWKKIFNNAIGKVDTSIVSNISNNIHIIGSIEKPNKEELISILKLTAINYEYFAHDYIYGFSLYPDDEEAIILMNEIENNLKKDGSFDIDLEPLIELKYLESLDFNNNSTVILFPLRDLKRLKYIKLSGNQITSLDGLPNNIIQLHCGCCKISDLSMIKELTKLQTIDICYNRISNLNGLEYLNELTDLDCSYNQIKSLKPLMHLKKLQRLNCVENLISEKEIQELLAHNPNLKIYN